MELVDDSKTYEFKYPNGEEVFVLKYWTVGMQDIVDRECVESDGKGGVKFLVSKERELQLKLTITEWRGIDFQGSPAPCNDENKKKLPVGVINWLIREIEEREGIRIKDAEKKTFNLQLS